MLAIYFYGGVFHVGTNGDGGVRDEGPRCRGPDEEARVPLITEGKPHVDARVHHGVRVLLVAEGDLGGGEGGLVAGAVGAYLETLVEEFLLVEGLQGPPDALYVGVVERAVGIFHVYPESESLAHLLPGFDVAEDGLAAQAVELLHAVALDIRF